jgi:hypothetical protein
MDMDLGVLDPSVALGTIQTRQGIIQTDMKIITARASQRFGYISPRAFSPLSRAHIPPSQPHYYPPAPPSHPLGPTSLIPYRDTPRLAPAFGDRGLMQRYDHISVPQTQASLSQSTSNSGAATNIWIAYRPNHPPWTWNCFGYQGGMLAQDYCKARHQQPVASRNTTMPQEID